MCRGARWVCGVINPFCEGAYVGSVRRESCLSKGCFATFDGQSGSYRRGSALQSIRPRWRSRAPMGRTALAGRRRTHATRPLVMADPPSRCSGPFPPVVSCETVGSGVPDAATSTGLDEDSASDRRTVTKTRSRARNAYLAWDSHRGCAIQDRWSTDVSDVCVARRLSCQKSVTRLRWWVTRWTRRPEAAS